MALEYKRPRVEVSAVMDGGHFVARLDRAIAKSGAKFIDPQPKAPAEPMFFGGTQTLRRGLSPLPDRWQREAWLGRLRCDNFASPRPPRLNATAAEVRLAGVDSLCSGEPLLLHTYASFRRRP
jgi:hypothetical protein